MLSPLLLLASALTWIPPQDARFTVNGLPWFAENKGEMIRLPRRLESAIPQPVWNLGLSPSGGRIRFRTASTQIAIRVEYPSPPNMRNMHAFGQTGVDLYIDGVYRSTAIAPTDATKGKTIEHTFFTGLPAAEREITLYLPLYKPANVLAIGLDEDAKIAKPRRFANPKPVVYYGTSITQGGCASRPGMSYQAILGRQLNLDFVNLGFSGNGKGEPAVADMTAEIDASLFVLDFSQNNPDIASVQQVYEPFLNTIRQKHPKTPIIAITPIANSTHPPRYEQYRAHIQQVVDKHIAAGDKLLTLVEGHTLLGDNQLDGLVDGSHPNDLGFQWMADALAPTVARVLTLPPPKLVDDSAIQVRPATAAALRRQIIEYIWGAPGIPATKPTLNADGTLNIHMEAGQENQTRLLRPKQKTSKLIILQHGHSCSFTDGAGLDHATTEFLNVGYAVLQAHMPHMRPGDCRTLPHAALFDLKLASGNALKFFLEPVLLSLNTLKPQFKEIHMVGLSGGGWTTTLMAAVEPAIRTSFPVAGTIPLYLRTGDSVGDKEQYLTEFYQLAGYQDLYVLGSLGRKQVQILNRRDNCCFGEAQHRGTDYAPAMQTYAHRVQHVLGSAGTFRLVIDEDAPKHMISPQAVQLMLKELAK